MSYPDNCLRGIVNKSFLEDGRVATPLFYFEKRHTRPDGWIEQSINWQDDEEAIDFTLSQRKVNGDLKFQAGIAVIPRQKIDTLKVMLPIVQSNFDYERQPLPENNYHGNLLLHENVPRLNMVQIAATLTLTVTRIISQSNI